MKYLIIVITLVFFQSCITEPTSEKPAPKISDQSPKVTFIYNYEYIQETHPDGFILLPDKLKGYNLKVTLQKLQGGPMADLVWSYNADHHALMVNYAESTGWIINIKIEGY